MLGLGLSLVILSLSHSVPLWNLATQYAHSWFGMWQLEKRILPREIAEAVRTSHLQLGASASRPRLPVASLNGLQESWKKRKSPIIEKFWLNSDFFRANVRGKKRQEPWLENSERWKVKKMWATSSISVQVSAQGNRQTKKNSGNVAINHSWKN